MLRLVEHLLRGDIARTPLPLCSPMIGYLLRHRQLEVGKVLDTKNRALQVRFLGSNQVLPLAPSALNDGTVVRECLSFGTRCRSSAGECVVQRTAHRPASFAEPYSYHVSFDQGQAAILSEVDLVPLPSSGPANALSRLLVPDIQAFELFRRREVLARVYSRVLRDGAGFRALLGSRVDLRPHQAFVAGTVILDGRRRYVLADEVGLGKTIEAGIVIHDLLMRRPDAKVLVLSPGALTQQWLSELFSKFGGQLFTLLDLHEALTIKWSRFARAIASLTFAAYKFPEQLASVPWDMLVVDEAHHLLASPVMYDFVKDLANRVEALLLLSAIPAHEREDELLRLLALLEPHRYTSADTEARVRFAVLFSLQTELGRKLRLLTRRIDGVAAGEFSEDDATAMADRLLELPVVCDDSLLREQLGKAKSAGAELMDGLRQFAHTAASRYRVNRRVLRNRRQRLVEQSQVVPIERRLRLLPYSPDQLEIEANDAALRLLRATRDAGLQADILVSFARAMLQSASVPSLPATFCRDFIGRSQPRSTNGDWTSSAWATQSDTSTGPCSANCYSSLFAGTRLRPL